MAKKNKIPIDLSNFENLFDLIYLPSKGLFYPNKKSSLMVKYLTAREEYILTSPSLREDGRALKMILESVIIDKDIKIKDLLVADKDAIILFLRSTAYGDKYPVEFVCTNCNNKTEISFAISSIEMNDICELPDENGEFEFFLKLSKKKVKFKPLTVADEEVLEKLLETKKKKFNDIEFKEEITSKYMLQLTEIDGNRDKKTIENFIKKMPLKDSSDLRNHIEKTEPGINKKIKLNCPNCEREFFDNLKINSDFLGITPKYRKNINEEVFLTWYYSHGGVTRDQAIKMSVADRKWTIQRISEEIEKKNKAEEAAMKKGKSSSGGSSRFKK